MQVYTEDRICNEKMKDGQGEPLSVGPAGDDPTTSRGVDRHNSFPKPRLA